MTVSVDALHLRSWDANDDHQSRTMRAQIRSEANKVLNESSKGVMNGWKVNPDMLNQCRDEIFVACLECFEQATVAKGVP